MKGITYAEYRQLLGKEKLIMKKNIVKRIIALFLLIVLCALGLFACKKNKIEVGGKVKADVNLSSIIVTASIKNDIFTLDDHINLVVGYGFWGSDIRRYLSDGKPLEMSIECGGFTVFDGESVFDGGYHKATINYSGSEYFADKKGKRYYVPNHYETYTLKFNSTEEQIQGRIIIQAFFDYEEYNWKPGYRTKIFYAVDKKKIAFSEKSDEDAKKKLS